MSEIELREIQASDVESLRPAWDALHHNHVRVAPEISGIAVRTAEDGWRVRRGKYEAWLGESHGFAIAALRDDEVLGYVLGRMAPGYAGWQTGDLVGRIETLTVVDSDRDTGIGAQLMEAAYERFRHAGAGVAMLSVIAANQRALDFYEREGFHPGSVELIKRLGTG